MQHPITQHDELSPNLGSWEVLSTWLGQQVDNYVEVAEYKRHVFILVQSLQQHHNHTLHSNIYIL